jgi:hypothetical protein
MLRKRRSSLETLAVEVEGGQADQPPWHYERIALHFAVRCDALTAAVLERVIRLAVVRYCGVLGTVRGVAKVEASFELTARDGTSTGRRAVRLDVAVAEALDARAPREEPSTADG